MDHPIPEVELYCDPGDTATTAIRRAIRDAMTDMDMLPSWKEYYPDPTRTSEKWLRSTPPVVRINRLCLRPPYTKQSIAQGLLDSSRTARRLHRRKKINMLFSFAVSLFIAFFPKCPFCWAAYLSLFGLTGSLAIPYRPWLLPVSILLLMINLTVLYFTRGKHGLRPFWLSVAGAALIVVNRLYFPSVLFVITGALLLLSAALWNSLSGRMSASVNFVAAALFKKTFHKH